MKFVTVNALAVALVLMLSAQVHAQQPDHTPAAPAAPAAAAPAATPAESIGGSQAELLTEIAKLRTMVQQLQQQSQPTAQEQVERVVQKYQDLVTGAHDIGKKACKTKRGKLKLVTVTPSQAAGMRDQISISCEF